MSLANVYVESTIPSFYHESRATPEIVARRDWTRQWWSTADRRFELATSEAVLDEIAGGISELAAARLELVQDLQLLPVEPAIIEIVEAYIRHKLMPAEPAGDALHLALT